MFRASRVRRKKNKKKRTHRCEVLAQRFSRVLRISFPKVGIKKTFKRQKHMKNPCLFSVFFGEGVPFSHPPKAGRPESVHFSTTFGGPLFQGLEPSELPEAPSNLQGVEPRHPPIRSNSFQNGCSFRVFASICGSKNRQMAPWEMEAKATRVTPAPSL